MQKEISVFRIDYEMRSQEEGEAKLWQACIAAYDQQAAVDYLGKFLGRTFKILQLGRECGLHAITDEIRQMIIEDYTKNLEPKKAVDKKEENTVGEEKPAAKRGRSITKK